MIPLKQWVLIKPQEQTQGTIITTEKKKPSVAQVLEVGKDVDTVKKGDMVVYSNYTVDDIEVDGVKHYFVKAEHLIATL